VPALYLLQIDFGKRMRSLKNLLLGRDPVPESESV
jgi:hypothetical protein